jgi:amidophosphoribosyltransferase
MVAPEDGDLARHAYYGLYALQHRGQEAAGIAAGDGSGKIRVVKREGIVSQAIRDADLNALDPCRAVVGHVRYATSGDESEGENDQPLAAKLASGHLALAHNGTLVNARRLARELEGRGAIFRSTIDSEIFVHLLAHNNDRPFPEALRRACSRVAGAYCLLLLHRGTLYALRDPHGFRPLFVGKKDGAQVVASETCAFDLIGAEVERELEPGELATLNGGGVTVERFLERRKTSPCIFELIYFARPDSTVFGRSVYDFRVRCGERLAEEAGGEVGRDPVGRDAVVVPVPDSGIPSAMGYARAAGLPFELALVRSHYVGRTFIQPFQEIRNLKVRLKLNAITAVIRDRDVVLVDDSLVRGTTCRRIVDMVRDHGARRVHVAIASPPIIDACHFGVDTPNRGKLAAGRMNESEIRIFLGADTLRYLSFSGMREVFGDVGFCAGCFTRDYPMDVSEAVSEREG